MKSVQQLAHLGSTSVRDVDYRVEINVPTAVSAKGSKGLFGSLVLRRQASGADYRVWSLPHRDGEGVHPRRDKHGHEPLRRR